MRKFSVLLGIVIMFLLAGGFCFAKSYTLDDALAETAQKIGKDAALPPTANFAVVGFVESTKRVRLPLSSVLEDDLTSFLTETRRGHVVAKNHIDTVLKELRITRDDLFDSRHRKQFGKLASADYIVSGNYWLNKKEIIINITVVNIESGLAVMAHRVKVRKIQISRNILSL